MRIAVAFARSTMTANASVCSACVEVLGVSGVGITVMGGDLAGPLCVSDERMRALEDLQFTAGEGPCLDAFVTRLPVFVERLDLEISARWLAFVDLAIAAGIGAVFAYPLTYNGATVGVMAIYQDVAGALTQEQRDDSVALCEVLTESVLSLQDASPNGVLAVGLDDAVAYRAQIHQASGMVSVQLHMSTSDALARIRAYAFANNLPIDSVAADIVTRRLRLTDDRHDPQEGARAR